jgi:hypothetical protein
MMGCRVERRARSSNRGQVSAPDPGNVPHSPIDRALRHAVQNV